MTATRQDVYSAIESERQYQNYRWPEAAHTHSITEFLVYIEHYLNKAKAIVSTEDGQEGALDDLRKITALGVAAMEQNGAKRREGW